MKRASRLARWLFRRAGRPVQAHPFAPRFEVLEDRLVPDAAPNLALRFTADNPTPAESDLFGYAVAASGDKVLVGDKQDDTGAHNAGKVVEYNANTGQIIRTIDNPFPGYADHFGDRLAFVGDNILVGCHYNDKFALNAGAVYLFSGKTGNLIRTFYSPNPMENALFGYAVTAVGTDKVLVGAERDSTRAFEAGAAYLFDVNTGALLHSFYSPTPDAGDRFGISVAAVGSNEVLIGAHYDDTKGEDAGAAYLFDVNTGALISTLTSPDPHAGDKFGYAVAGSDGRVLVGAYADDHAGPDAGAAYLYDASGHLLQKYVTPTGRADAEFGWSVAFAGKDVLVGAPQDANGNGATYLFSGTTGALLNTFANPRPDNGRMFGYSVAADGLSNIAVGSPRVDAPYPNCGAAYFYGGTSSLGGSVWSDLNNDGIRQTAEFGIAGVTVTLTGSDARGNAVRLTQPTDTDGFYKFTGLTAGTYTLTETQPTSFLDGKDRLGTAGGTVLGNDQFSVKIADHADGLKYNFGELRPASLAGTVYADANNNGTRDGGEAGIAGVKFSLTGTDDLGALVSLTATTAADGSYSFAGLRPGTYAIREAQPAGYLDGKDTVGTAGGVGGNDATSGVVLTASTKGIGYDFGELIPASLAGSVYVDRNNDGTRQAGETGIAGVAVTLTGTDDLGSAVHVTAATGTDGGYAFTGLRPGAYNLTEAQPASYLDGKDAVGTLGGTVGNDVVSAVTVRVGNAGSGYTFGELPPAGALAGAVYVDGNNDGVRQAGESGIGGVAVTLTGTDGLGNAVSLAVTTAADGSYSFGGLRPGSYRIAESQPVAYLDGKDTAGTLGGTVGNDVFTAITLAPGASGTGYNFGELRPAGLAGSVYADANNDGTRQATESGIAGAAVTLTGTDDLGNAVKVTATTAADGSYSFGNLRPGTYAIAESQPGNYLDGKDTVGTLGGAAGNDVFTAVAVTPGSAGTGYVFGELPPASLAGSVYVDGNNDGIRQAAEGGIGGATVTLTGTDDLGNAVRVTVITAADGSFLFGNLRPGVYAVAETQPAGYVDGKDAAGTLGGTVGNDVVSAVTVRVGNAGSGYTFGETGQPVSKGQTATIGFWANKNGQQVIRSFGTTQSGLTLANWLATSLPKLYGQGGMYDLRGKTNADVASLFVTLFNVKGQKTEAQILATALAVFTTTDALDRDPAARATAAGFGFQITAGGVGTASWNVGSNNAAFGLAANSSVSVLTLLQGVNDRVSGGKLFGGNQTSINQANSVFDGINQAGDI